MPGMMAIWLKVAVMESFKNFRVAAVHDDPLIRQNLTEVIRGWGLGAEGFAQPEKALSNVGGNKCDVILLDVFIRDVCCLELIPQFGNDKKIIIITGFSEKNTAIRALKLGAFDLLEKPIQNELLYHSVLRALTAIAKERESEKLIGDLRQSRSELLAHQQRLERLNAMLFDTNRALSVFAQNVEQQREEIKRQIALEVRNIIMPEILRLRNDPALHKHKTQLDTLAMQIEDLTSGFTIDSRFARVLSFTEMRIASLIKNGLSAEEIARQLHVAESTVRTHRKNIRRKLKLTNARFSLRSFLNAGG